MDRAETIAERLRHAQQWHLEGKWDKAEQAYMVLLNAAPHNAQLLYLAGTLHLQRAQYGLALHLLQAAVIQAPDFVEARINLGAAAFRLGRLEQARTVLEQALALQPEHPDILASLAALYVHDGQPQHVLEYTNAALAHRPGHPAARWNAAQAHLELGEWAAGWEHYSAGYLTGDRERKRYPALGDLPDWEGAAGQRVLVHGEMGLGDEILFASCLPDFQARSAAVVFDCHPRLEPLFQRSFPGVRVIGTRKTDEPVWPDPPQVDAVCGIGDLPGYFRTQATDFPTRSSYLMPDPAKVETCRRRLAALEGTGPRVAIAWRGGTTPTRSNLRSIPPRQWGPILASGATFVSVQYGPEAAGEAQALGIPHWQAAIDDLDEQAALLAACDLVISVCQTAVHLAGALGVPCWCLTPARPAWRYGVQGDGMPWYPSVRLWRQSAEEEAHDAPWGAVVDRVAAALREWIRTRGSLPGGARRTMPGGV